MRAFEAGKMDLTQAEGLGDLLDAETEAQRRQAMGQLGGRLAAKGEAWRADLLAALSALEAAVDFPDEEDVPGGVADRARTPLARLRDDMQSAIAGAGGAVRLREGVTVVIVGPPNAGKSSLLNRLAGTDRAIVSDEAGTTRDLLEVRLDIGGQLVTLIDTAGLREAEGHVEREGIERARKAATDADIRVEVRDARTVQDTAEPTEAILWVANKADMRGDALPSGWLRCSALTGDGIADLTGAINERVAAGGAWVLTRDRHVALVRQAHMRLAAITDADVPPEIMAEEVRQALTALEELTGRIAPDEVLGDIFSNFCIGK